MLEEELVDDEMLLVTGALELKVLITMPYGAPLELLLEELVESKMLLDEMLEVMLDKDDEEDDTVVELGLATPPTR